MIFLPVTRYWSLSRVISALDSSDCPKNISLLIDNVGCERWVDTFDTLGWNVEYRYTGNGEPPLDRIERRDRHRAMRKLSQEMTRGYQRVLYIEDDTIVPRDVWSRLTAVLKSGYRAASGVQRDRHGSNLLGLWSYDNYTECFDPVSIERDSGVYSVDAVGHYCLMTDGNTYAEAEISPYNTSLDRTHTAQFGPIGVDSSVWCGHLTREGVIE